MNFGNIQKFPVVLKIWLKIESFDHSSFDQKFWAVRKWDFWPLRTKDEIGQNQEILSHVENLAKNWHFWPLGTCKGGNLVKFRNFQSHLKFWSKLRVLTTQNLFWEIFSRVENLAWNREFDPSCMTFEGWNFAKSRNFDSCQKFSSKLMFLTTQDMRRMKFGKIQKFLVALKIWLKLWEFWPLRTSKGWNLAKFRNF